MFIVVENQNQSKDSTQEGMGLTVEAYSYYGLKTNDLNTCVSTVETNDLNVTCMYARISKKSLCGGRTGSCRTIYMVRYHLPKFGIHKAILYILKSVYIYS